MKRLVFALITVCAALSGDRQSIHGPYQTSVNFSIDLEGTPDTRPTTWGEAGSAQNVAHFHPPAGYRVRILRVSGDFVAWPRSGVMASGTYCEVGWGLKTSAPDGSQLLDYAYDNSLLWVQNVVLPRNPSARAAFDRDVSAGGILPQDNALISQSFVALNTSGLTIHMEPTFTVTFQFEPIP